MLVLLGLRAMTSELVLPVRLDEVLVLLLLQ